MKATYEQTRAMYGSDEQMARALFEHLAVARLDLQLQQALRRRAEDGLRAQDDILKKYREGRSE